MALRKDIRELLDAGLITDDQAQKIEEFYMNKTSDGSQRLYIIFGILGALLTGLGIISILAHNWDNFSPVLKSTFAFLPLLAGQMLCGYTLLRQSHSVAWRESSSTFLFLAVGACIALISQIYNIPGDLDSFILTWMLLCMPLIFLMRSSMASLLYLTGITYFAVETGYGSYSESLLYWPLLLPVIIHYGLSLKHRPGSNFIFFHNWLIPASLLIVLGTIANDHSKLMYMAYFSLLGIFYAIGHFPLFLKQKFITNGFRILGAIGTTILLLVLSFDNFWNSLRSHKDYIDSSWSSQEFFVTLILTLLALGSLYVLLKDKDRTGIRPFIWVFALFIPIFYIGTFSYLSVILVNLLILVIGLLTIRNGVRQDHLGIINFGLLIISALVICRFFDQDLNFIIRGVLFVALGIGFIMTNYLMLKKRKNDK